MTLRRERDRVEGRNSIFAFNVKHDALNGRKIISVYRQNKNNCASSSPRRACLLCLCDVKCCKMEKK